MFSRAASSSHVAAIAAARSDVMSAALAQNWWAIAIRCVAAVLFGAIALLAPAIALLSLVIVFAAYLLIDGAFAIVAAVRAMRRHERWGLLVVSGLASLVAAAFAIGWPGITVLVFIWLIAAWAVITGSLELFAAFRLNRDHGQAWMAVGGIASTVFGLLLITAPLIGAVVLAWWIGAYALISGVTLGFLAFRLRRSLRGERARA
ncbi:MAG TPA: HdeD family acid-resistance protein [Caulobacteraceae bacterium]|jgi:uncharacterized membrane protein HdeD (DUF308 family)